MKEKNRFFLLFFRNSFQLGRLLEKSKIIKKKLFYPKIGLLKYIFKSKEKYKDVKYRIFSINFNNGASLKNTLRFLYQKTSNSHWPFKHGTKHNIKTAYSKK